MYENCLLLKLYSKLRKMFLSPRRESNTQPSHLQWDALTIELPGLRWQREDKDMYRFVSATHVQLNSSLDMPVYLINEYICMRMTCKHQFAIKLEKQTVFLQFTKLQVILIHIYLVHIYFQLFNNMLCAF